MAQSAFPRFPRGRLSQRLLDCLQQNSVFLQENLDAFSIVNELYANMVLDDTERDNILGLEGCRNSRQEQNRRLVSKLTMRTDRGFETFLQALSDTGHEGTLRRIQEWLSRNTSDSSDIRLTTQEETSVESEGPKTNLTDSAKQEALSELQGRVVHVENRLDILSTRMIRLDPTLSQQQKDEAVELRRKLEEAREEIEHLKQLLDYKSQDLEKAREEVSKLEQQIIKLNEEQQELEDKLRIEERKRKDQEKQIKIHEKKIREQEDKIKIQEIKMKEQEKKMKIQKNKLLEQIHNTESKLTEEMKKQQHEHRKEVTVLVKSFKHLASQLEDQSKIVHEMQKKQSEIEQASKSTCQAKNASKVELQSDPVQPSGPRQRQTTRKPVTGLVTFSIKDNTSKRK